MNPTAIYSKSGKGVQEASGKTNLLKRPDRSVLSAIDGRATLGDVAQKVGKTFDPEFVKLIVQLDKDGFIREVSPGAASGAKPAAGKPAAKAAESGGADLDFSSLGGPPKPAPKPAAPPKPDPAAEALAKAQQSALQKAREEAESKAQAERDRARSEAEAKIRLETESKLRSEAEAKARADAETKIAAEAEAKIKAARDAAVKAAAEASAKAQAEAKRAREEAERIRRDAEEKERARKEAEEKARREAEELRQRLEEERKAREAAERKAREEAERARKELEEERRKLEEERKHEEQERAERRRREEEEERERRRKRDEEDEEHRRKRQEESSARAVEASAPPLPAIEEEKPQPAIREEKAKPPAAAPAAGGKGGGGMDSLLADLDNFTSFEEGERKEREENERKVKEEAERRAREDAERRAKEEAEFAAKEAERERKEQAKRKKKEDEEALARDLEKNEARLSEEEEKRKQEADVRARKAKQEEVLAAQAQRGSTSAIPETMEQRRERMLGKKQQAAPAAEPGSRKRSSAARTVAMLLLVLLAVAVGVLHFLPVPTDDFERAASEALGRPVKIGEARLSLIKGLELRFHNVSIGDDVKLASVTGVPDLDSLRGEKKLFSRIEIDDAKLPQEALGEVLLARVKGDNFIVRQVVVRKLELTGPLPLPKPLQATLGYDLEGTLREATLRGPDTLVARLLPGKDGVDVVITATGMPLPFLSAVTLSDFGLKGTATQQGMRVSEWGGKIFGGALTGTANIRWGGNWTVEGIITGRNINAAVFAPALLSEGRGEGSGRFSMSGADPAKLAANGRMEGTFTVNGGALGSVDIGRWMETQGVAAGGRTPFTEMSGNVIYDRGTVQLRNVTIAAGALNAGASADIAEGGELSGRIIADVKGTKQTLRATLNLGGTVKEPQVRK